MGYRDSHTTDGVNCDRYVTDAGEILIDGRCAKCRAEAEALCASGLDVYCYGGDLYMSAEDWRDEQGE